MVTLELLVHFEHQAEDLLVSSALASPTPIQTSNSKEVRGMRPEGQQSAYVPRLCLGPASCLALSFQLCSGGKNMYYAQNKH